MSEYKFKPYALAFYRSGDKIYPCQIECPIVTEKLVKQYWVRVTSGEKVVKREDDLLTGFEPEFSNHSSVEWGNFQIKDELDELEPEYYPYDDLLVLSDTEIDDYYLETLGIE